MDTASCPHCHQAVNAQAVTCPYCRTTLKAYGHPGIPLHRAIGETYLCESCTYHADDTCNFPQRPYAKECTLYQDVLQTQLEINQRHDNRKDRTIALKSWLRRYQSWLLLLALLFVSFLLALR